ncbi:hypothetical protein EYF80_037464 [Liparis tanakae]|uniref:Uncharacterized protein n=1 Tax=Liparis tanakae TaxID=230148 RepID=A0A4Z2GGA2_9TELE|nr:hypothetical protein EYF80_037464 [Liparis tanakae]
MFNSRLELTSAKLPQPRSDVSLTFLVLKDHLEVLAPVRHGEVLRGLQGLSREGQTDESKPPPPFGCSRDACCGDGALTESRMEWRVIFRQVLVRGFGATCGRHHRLTAAAAPGGGVRRAPGAARDADKPMFLCRKRMKVAAMMFRSLQLSSTGGCCPSTGESCSSSSSPVEGLLWGASKEEGGNCHEEL